MTQELADVCEATGGAAFARTYEEARERFLAAARRVGADIAEYENPASGPSGERLFTTVARLGPAAAERALVTISGTHGVEGFCGSACQVDWMRRDLLRPDPETSIVHIHAINPYGFAAVARGDEGNVDINRNFLGDWADPPRNAGYAALAHALTAAAWAPDVRAKASQALQQHLAAHGRAAWQAAVMGGQYMDPEGLFYGGARPCWANRTFETIARDHLAAFRRITALDIHTGLGARGAMEVMAISPPADVGYARLRAAFGADLTSPYAATSNAQLVRGPLLTALPDWLPSTELALVAVEFGTMDTPVVIDALRADNWARRFAPPGSAEWREVKAHMRRCFCPLEPDWEACVLAQAEALARQLPTSVDQS